MDSGGQLTTSCPLLLLLLLLLPCSHHGQPLRHTLPTQRAQDPPAVHLDNGLGQEPVTVMTFDLTRITKTTSSFEFRTWDPEGVILYGDTNPKDDWFMLGLRDGRPEIQLLNHWSQLTVGAGPRLDDGRWHQVDVKMDGDSVMLRVDRKELVPTLDGCLRRDTWLDKQAQTSASAPTSLRSCDIDLQPGIFFPPGTHAEFSLRDIPQPHAEPWAFSLDLGLKLAAGLGHLLALGTPENTSWLSLYLQDQKVMLSPGWGPGLDLPLVLGHSLQLTLSASRVVLSQGPMTEVFALPALDLGPLFNLWAQPQGRLFLGALTGEDSSASFCLNGLWAQGQRLDMDRALNRSQDIWTRSCPQSLGNGTDNSH
ncbi:sex hormone-binding globulin isoform X2 [Nycticebus coucang]|uniref:sex hormone-binding globulin isoform X2 n=1 Tax=Nycticebus coucang TaxID=9470 RepID=UPI00234DF27E|nr:sex hormone-binding globulin isoform X2 [Nycticebus coucang]